MHCRIICIGNSLFAPDSAGPMVHDILSRMELPADTELIDGGLAGLGLLCFLEQVDLVLFVDAVTGFTEHGGVVLIDPLEELEPEEGFDHNAGLAYLLRMAPQVLDTPMPNIHLIGIEGDAQRHHCREAAEYCRRIISEFMAGGSSLPYRDESDYQRL